MASLANSTATGIAQQADDTGLLIDVLILVRARSPGGLVTLDRNDVLGSPRYAVQRAAVMPRGDLRVSLPRLGHGKIIEKRDDAVDLPVVLLEATQVHLGQLDRGHRASFEQLRELRHGPEGDLLQITGPLQLGRRAQSNGRAARSTFIPGTIGLK